MAAFDYLALDAAGKRRKGVLNADSARQARRELRRLNLTPLDVKEAGRGVNFATLPRLEKLLNRPLRLTSKELAVTTRQLATLISAASPVEEALHTIALQSEAPKVRKALADVRAGVTEGARLSQALGRHPQVFSPLYRAMVAAGETAGGLGEVMERLADHLERSRKLRGKITSALVYPALLSVVAFGVVALLMTFVVPQVADQFDGLGQDLPLLTKIMIGVSGAFQDFGPILILAALAVAVAFSRALKNEGVRRRVDAALMKTPIVGPLQRDLQAARLARTLSALAASDAPVMEGLEASRATVRNLALQDAIAASVAAVRDGATLSQALKRAGAFPPILIYMTAMGERSGALAPMLAKAADYLENELEETTQTALSLMEPLIILVLGGLVAVIVLSILLPILRLNTLAIA